jgi:methionyl-tRNA formyltransferase
MHSIKKRKRKKKLKHGEVTTVAIKLDLKVNPEKLKKIFKI